MNPVRNSIMNKNFLPVYEGEAGYRLDYGRTAVNFLKFLTG